MIAPKKALVFDSGAIVTLALNDLLYILEPLKKAFGGEFFLTGYAKEEVVDRPIKTKRFMLEALMIRALINKGIFHLVTDYGLGRETGRIIEIANRTFRANEEWIRVIHEGEASCLALFNLLPTDKKALVIDERTTRVLCEAPENLRKLLESKLHTKIEAIKTNYDFFKGFRVIRTSELCWFAFKKGIIKLPAKPQDAIKALLFALKFKGCAISSREIAAAKRL